MTALGGFLGDLEKSWGHLGWNVGHLGEVLEPLGDVLGAYKVVLGGSWAVLGRSWRLSRTILEAFLMIFAFLKQLMKIAKNLGKPMVFH